MASTRRPKADNSQAEALAAAFDPNQSYQLERIAGQGRLRTIVDDGTHPAHIVEIDGLGGEEPPVPVAVPGYVAIALFSDPSMSAMLRVVQ